MTAIASHLSRAELEARYETAADPVAKSHFHAIWLLSLHYEIEDVAEILSFAPRWVRQLVKRYNVDGPDSLGDRRAGNKAAPPISAGSLPRVRLPDRPGEGPIAREACRPHLA